MNNVIFDDIAGYENEKRELLDIARLLVDHKKYSELGIRIPRGVLLAGEPGLGKTIMAKALANEINASLYIFESDNILSSQPHESIETLFKKAKQNPPAIIFADEIDKNVGFDQELMQREDLSFQKQFISCMDQLNAEDGVMVVATTNNRSSLGNSLLRPGRFDRSIKLKSPTCEDRKAIINLYTKKKSVDNKLNVDELSRYTAGLTGADIECIINDIAITFFQDNLGQITSEVIQKAINRVILGSIERKTDIDSLHKKVIASHEAGHAIVAFSCNNGIGAENITTIPQGDMNGFTLLHGNDNYI